MPRSLQDELDAITAKTRKLVQPERLGVSERATAELSLQASKIAS